MNSVPLRWVTEPFDARLFYLYLVVLSCITLMYALRLARRLFSAPGRRRVSFEQIYDGSMEAGAIAKAALANRIACEPGHHKVPPPRSISRESALRLMLSAETRFVFQWEKSQADIMWLNRMARLTLLLSLIIVFYTAFSTWLTVAIDNPIMMGFTSLFGALSLLLKRLALGMGVSAVLFGISSCYERSLANRGATWKYLSSRFKNEWTVE